MSNPTLDLILIWVFWALVLVWLGAMVWAA